MEYLQYLIILVSVVSIECKTWFLASDIKKIDKILLPTPVTAKSSNFKPSNPLKFPTSNLFEASISKKTFRENITSESNEVQHLNTKSQPKRKTIRRHHRRPQFEQMYSKTHNDIQSRFLEVFEVVQFEHVKCLSSTGLEGTCLHEYDCQKINGTAMGTCADGYGICCIILLKCDTHSSAPTGWLTNPNYPGPSTDRLSCTLTLEKAKNEIKQLRLDFMTFEILPPIAGTCEQDQFVVTGQNINNVIPILCGINSGQHLYIEVSASVDPITLSFQTISSENRLFAIKITQLSSSDILSAPSGCLQYYEEDQGHMESFNYRDTTEIGITRASSYLNNLNYAMCINRKADSCSVTYTNTGDMQIVNYDSEGLPVLPPRQAGVEIFDCPSDWLLISALRLCGERLNDGSVLQDFSLDAPVIDDAAGPIIVLFRSDGVYTGRGFRLHYQQNLCMQKTA